MSPSPASVNSIDMIKRLVAFDTTSRNSNLELIDFASNYLSDLGVECELVHSEDGRKANLYATLGPSDKPGIALSGHTDVVPVDGQNWDSDPFEIIEKEGRLYGRGSADMKGFIAVCLALAPEFLKRQAQTPLHLVLSYDEEVGCLGVRSLIDKLAQRDIKPRACIIGEPTEMIVVRGHKGKLSLRCRVQGHESHSGLAHLGVNAVEAAAEVVAYLKRMARRHRDQGPYDAELSPPYTTVHTGLIQGGTALNIVPKECAFDFEFRHLPQDDPEALAREVQQFAETQLLPEMREVSPEVGFTWEPLSRIPGLSIDDDADLVRLAQAFTESTTTGKVSFGTEAGLFQQADMPAIVCGPGNIEQAHKPNEYVALDQIGRCETFIRRLFEHCWQTS